MFLVVKELLCFRILDAVGFPTVTISSEFIGTVCADLLADCIDL